MESFSTLDQASAGTGAKRLVAGAESGSNSAGSKSTELQREQAARKNSSARVRPASISAALAAAHAEASAKLEECHLASGPATGVRFPGEDGGRSLAEMAQRDLDAALQLLADRAQYITGASGAAIAIRRDGRNDMLCRASAGMNAPELGALLSTEFGLSGESVRTRRALRCDDAERDKRVNHEVCRQMGIASVVVMPVVNDDEVLGVFELFSGKANAFGVRDVSAVQRLSEMVETAVRLAQAAQNLPERLKMSPNSGPAVEVGVEDLEIEVLEDRVLKSEVTAGVLPQQQILPDRVLPDQIRGPVNEELPNTKVAKGATQEAGSTAALKALRHPKTSPTTSPETLEASPAACPETVVPKKKLFWSAARNAAADAGRAEEADQSHVPPILRSLHKCEACGFPVSAGRMLCVECEEKKWRGQLKATSREGKISSTAAAVAVPKSLPKPEVRAFAAAAQSVAASTLAPTTQSASAAAAVSTSTVTSIKRATAVEPAAQALEIPPPVSSSVLPSVRPPAAPSEFVLSAGLESSQSWLGTNKYIVGVLLVVAAAVAAVFLMR